MSFKTNGDDMTLIICAIRPEVKPFLSALENTKVEKCGSLKVNCGVIQGESVLVVCCGVGFKKASAATQKIIDNYSIDNVIMSGTAGGVDGKLKIGDTVVSEEVLYHETGYGASYDSDTVNEYASFKTDNELLLHAKRAAESESFSQSVFFGRITSGSKFASGKYFRTVADKFHPLCLDMETAAVAHVCSKNNIPFIAVRSISDTAEKSGLLTFYKNVTLASRNSFNFVEKLLSELSGQLLSVPTSMTMRRIGD